MNFNDRLGKNTEKHTDSLYLNIYDISIANKFNLKWFKDRNGMPLEIFFNFYCVILYIAIYALSCLGKVILWKIKI